MRLTLQQLADRVGVDEGFVHRLVALGGLHTSQEPFGERDLHLVALLHRWEEAGIGAETVLRAMEQGDLSLSFLATPGFELTGRLDCSYRRYAEESDVPLDLILGLHEAIGFARPDPDDRIREDDPILVEMAAAFLESGSRRPRSAGCSASTGTTSGGWLRRSATCIGPRSSSDSVRAAPPTPTSWSA